MARRSNNTILMLAALGGGFAAYQGLLGADLKTQVRGWVERAKQISSGL